MMHLCRMQGAVGWGRGMHTSPSEGWVIGGPGVLSLTWVHPSHRSPLASTWVGYLIDIVNFLKKWASYQGSNC